MLCWSASAASSSRLPILPTVESVEEQRLSVGVGDDAYAGVAKELGQFGLHLHAERGRGDGVDDTTEIAGRSIVGGYTCATCAQVRVIIGAIEDIGDAGRFTN